MQEEEKMFSSTRGIQLWIRYYLCSGYACIFVSKSGVQLPDAQKPIEASESHLVVSNSLQPLDYTAHGILQASILEWVAIPSPRGSSQPRDQTQVMSMYDKNHYNIVK